MNDDHLDDEIRARVQAQISERARRRERMRKRRAEFERARRYGLTTRHRTKAARWVTQAEEGSRVRMTEKKRSDRWPPIPAPADRVQHRWSCTRRGPYTETLVQRPTGQAVVTIRCEECNGDDSTDDPEAA